MSSYSTAWRVNARSERGRGIGVACEAGAELGGILLRRQHHPSASLRGGVCLFQREKGDPAGLPWSGRTTLKQGNWAGPVSERAPYS